MDRPIDRFIKYLSFKGINASQAEKALELGNAYIQNSNNRKGEIGSSILSKIVKEYVDINLNWLVTGDGQMLKENKRVNYADTPYPLSVVSEPGERINANSPRQNTHIFAEKTTSNPTPDAPPTAPPTEDMGVKAVYLTPQIITVDNAGNDNIVFVPVKAAAGYLNGYEDQSFMEKLPSFSLPGLNNSTYRAFEVDGDSMWPTLQNKEIVVGQWVEKLDYIREDRVHIIVTKTAGIIVKRLLNRIEKYGYIVAKSDAVNDRNLYPNIHVYPDDVLELWYAVTHIDNSFKAPSDLWKRQNNLEADLTDVLRRLKEAGL